MYKRQYAMRAVLLHQCSGPEKLKFEDNVPEPQISGSTVLIAAAAASVNPIDWKLRSGTVSYTHLDVYKRQLLSVTASGTGTCAAASARSLYFAETPPGP